MNELHDLIINYQRKHFLTRNTLVQKLGYSNITKGLRRLDKFIKRPSNTDFKFKLSQQLNIPINILDEVVNKQLSIMPKVVKVEKFIPFIQVAWLKGPSLLMNESQLSHLYRIEIPSNLLKPTFDQVCDLYKQHQLKKFAQILNVPDTLDCYPQFVKAVEKSIKDEVYVSYALGNGFTYHKSRKGSFSFNLHCEPAYDYFKKRVNTDNSDISAEVIK